MGKGASSSSREDFRKEWGAAAVAVLAALLATPAPAAAGDAGEAASANLALATSSGGSALERVMRAQGQPMSRALSAAVEAPAPTPPAAPAEVFRTGPNLFGSIAVPVGATALGWRWREAEAAALPRSARWNREVRAISGLPMNERLERANIWVNRALRFTSDAQVYGEADHWAGAREALARGRGDCEDFALTKLQLLRAAGVAATDLFLVVVRDTARRNDHAVLAVRLDGRFVILDNGADQVLEAASVRDYRPLITFNAAGAWAHGFREPAPLMLADTGRVEPAAAATEPSS